jgi:hypothetical protein
MIQYSQFSIQRLHQRLFFLLLVLLPTQLGLHFWPQWAHLLGRRIDYLSPTLYVTDVLTIFVLLSWFVERFPRIMNHELGIMRKMRRKLSLSSFIIHNSLFTLLILFVVFNIWFATSPWVAVYKWVKVAEFVGLGWYIIKTRPDLSWVTFPLSIGVLYSSVLAITQFILQHSVGGPLWLLGERSFTVTTPGVARLDVPQLLLRPYATFPHPNVLGGFLAVLLPVMMHNTKRKKLYDLLTITVGLLALCITFSRSAWIVGGVAIALSSARIMNYEFRIMKKALFAGFVLFIILYSLFMIQGSLTIQRTDESFERRIELNQAAIRIWQHSPLVGAGLGNFLVELPKFTDAREVNFLQPTHNIYLLLLSETGMVGLVLFLWLVWRGILGNADNKGNMRRISLIVLLVLGLVDHYPVTLQQGQLLLTVVIGLVLQRHHNPYGHSHES